MELQEFVAKVFNRAGNANQYFALGHGLECKEQLNDIVRLIAENPEHLAEDKPAELEKVTNTENSQGAPQQQSDKGMSPDERYQILRNHAARLPANLKNRDQVVSSARLFADWRKVDLSHALDCPVDKVPEALADYLGFTEKSESETADQENYTEI